MGKVISLKSQAGSALINILVAASVLGIGGMTLMKSSVFQKKLTREAQQDQVINQTVERINTLLTDSQTCNDAFPDFTSIAGGQIRENLGLDKGVTLVSINAAQVGATSEYTINLAFRKDTLSTDGGAGANKTTPRTVRVKRYENSQGNFFCSSYETTGGQNAIRDFCEDLGGDFTEATGRCQFNNRLENTADSQFQQRMSEAVCRLIGGNFAGGQCSQIDLQDQNPGTVQTGNLTTSRIDISGRRTSFEDTECTGTRLPTSVNQNSTLNCSNVNCNALAGNPRSNYVAERVGDVIRCRCERNGVRYNGRTVSCGSRKRATDPNYCSRQTGLDDECGVGGTCYIERASASSVTSEYGCTPEPVSCGQSHRRGRNACGDSCTTSTVNSRPWQGGPCDNATEITRRNSRTCQITCVPRPNTGNNRTCTPGASCGMGMAYCNDCTCKRACI